MTKPFIITGCGRSGTMLMARLLNAMGIRTSFEEFFTANSPLDGYFPHWLRDTHTCGEVSSLAVPYLRYDDFKSREVVLLHQVRNPVAVVASLMGQETWTEKRWWPNVKFNFRHLPILDPENDDPLVLSMKYWAEWNRLVENAGPVFQYRIEDILKESFWEELLTHIEEDVPRETVRKVMWTSYSDDYNHRERDTSISWHRIPDSQLKHSLYQQALSYGYSAIELANYCPCGEDCPHCRGPLVRGQGAYLVHIQSEFPRYMRKPEGSGPPNADYIQGLIDLYRTMRVWHGKGVEVGSWTGESAEIAAQFLKSLTCVDPWEPPDFSANEELFDKRTAAYPNITKLKKPSHVACHDFEDESLDCVYIDGMHDYENVYRDICSWFSKVKRGGWIAGHDYDDMDTHVGVVQAVDELLGTPAHRFADSSWAFVKTDALVQHFLAHTNPDSPEDETA